MGYRPPAPEPRDTVSIADRELLALLPRAAYEDDLHRFELGRRSILVVNTPAGVRDVLIERPDVFPKSDVMVSALAPLLGEGVFIAEGETWRRQRVLLEPALATLRIKAVLPHVERALEGFAERVGGGGPVSLAAEVSALMLEIICRSIFSSALSEDALRAVARHFSAYQEELLDLGPLALLLPTRRRPSAALFAEAKALRGIAEELVDERLAATRPDEPPSDLLQAVIDARGADGSRFDRDGIVDQVMVFFLAGHETSASALTWALFILSQQPELADALRAEALAVGAGRRLGFEDVARLTTARAALMETIRLYPPAGFITRRVAEGTTVAGAEVPEGSLVVISPWLIHRHRKLWTEPDMFDVSRFGPGRERSVETGSYLPFGLGPRTCTGRALALFEGPLILAELHRRFRIHALEPGTTEVVSRLTIQPRDEIPMVFEARDA
jgi:cytochrome P450